MMPPPGMRRRAAHVEVLDRRPVLGPSRHGPQEEELLESQLALEDVAFREPEVALEVERREDLPVLDDVLDVRRVLGDRVDDRVAEGLALLVPVALEVVGRVLHEARHDVLAGRSEGGVRQGRDDHVDVGTPGEAAVLGVVVGALHVLDRRRDRDRATQVRPVAGQRPELGQGVEREVDLARRAPELVALDVLDELPRQLLLADELHEGQPRVDARGHDAGADLLARLEHDTRGLAARDQDLGDRGLRADLDTELHGPRPAQALEMAPVPPRAKPHARNAPSMSPM